jgi:hypothetical protein
MIDNRIFLSSASALANIVRKNSIGINLNDASIFLNTKKREMIAVICPDFYLVQLEQKPPLFKPQHSLHLLPRTQVHYHDDAF